MPVMTYVKNSEPPIGTGEVNVAAGSAFLGGQVNMTQTEINELKAEGVTLLEGPGSSPGAPKLGSMALAEGAAGLPTGAYKYVVTYTTAIGETIASAEITITVTSKKVLLSNIPIAPANAGVTGRKIYRTIAGGATGTEKLLTTIADNSTTTFEDNLADGSLTTALPAADTSSNQLVVEAAQRAFQWHQGT